MSIQNMLCQEYDGQAVSFDILLEFMVTKTDRFVCSLAMCRSHPLELVRISANIIRWCCENNVNKVVVVSGIFPGNIVPFPQDFAKRTSFLVENDGKLRNDIEHSGSIVNGSETPNFAFIGGVPGQLLANCVIQFIHCMACTGSDIEPFT